MATSTAAGELRFEAPGPAFYELDPVHFPRPLTRYWATNGPILNNGGDKVELRRFDDVLVTCTAWGSRSC